MNSFLALAVVLCAFVGCNCAEIKLDGQGKYITRFDNVNVDAILANKKLVRQYILCLLNGQPCLAEGTELRTILPDALKTNCSKCKELHIKNILKVYEFAQKEFPGDWKKLVDRWDPTGEYVKAFLQKFAPEKL